MARFDDRPADTQVQRCKPLLGTYVDVNLSGPLPRAELMALSQVAFNRIQDIHSAMSFHEPASELSRLNRAKVNDWTPLSDDMRAVLEFALELSRVSAGVFDVTVAPQMVRLGLLPRPEGGVEDKANWLSIQLGGWGARFHESVMIDLGGIAKGYAVDMAIEALREVVPASVRFSVNAGGDLRFSDPEDERVKIRSLKKGGGTIILKPPFASVATSGSYFVDNAPSAIIDPSTAACVGMDARSVSVFADSCMTADALTKIVALVPDTEKLLTRYNARALVQADGREKWVN